MVRSPFGFWSFPILSRLRRNERFSIKDHPIVEEQSDTEPKYIGSYKIELERSQFGRVLIQMAYYAAFRFTAIDMDDNLFYEDIISLPEGSFIFIRHTSNGIELFEVHAQAPDEGDNLAITSYNTVTRVIKNNTFIITEPDLYLKKIIIEQISSR